MPTRFKSSNALSDAELAQAAFADLDPGFSAKAQAGEYGIVVAGVNFGGGGKTVEGPVFALRGAGIRLVIADSFARYFLRNAINNGFPILVCPGISQAVQTGQQLGTQGGRALHLLLEPAPTEPAHRGRRDRFDGGQVAVAQAYANDVAREQEAGDNPPTVAQYAHSAQGPRDDLEHMFGGIALPEQGLSLVQPFDDLRAEHPVKISGRHGRRARQVGLALTDGI